MSKLEKTIIALVEVFEKYAGTDDDKSNLSHKEFRKLIDELSTGFKTKMNLNDVDKVLKKIDKNNDGQLSFKEFANFVSGISSDYFDHKLKVKG